MAKEIEWLREQRLVSCEKMDHTWFFRFGDDRAIATESLWRLIDAEQIRVTSEDHEQQFGLPQPVDAGDTVVATIGTRQVVRACIQEPVSDLVIDFGEGLALQFLAFSCGYESWRAYTGTKQAISTGGGGLAEYT